MVSNEDIFECVFACTCEELAVGCIEVYVTNMYVHQRMCFVCDFVHSFLDEDVYEMRRVSSKNCIKVKKIKIHTHTYIHANALTHTHTGGALGVMFIVAGYGHGNTSSNPERD